MQNFELVECYYISKISKTQCQLHTILNQNKQNKLKMPDSIAAAASTAASDPAAFSVSITPRIISITAEKQQLTVRSHSQSSVDILSHM